MHDLLTDAQLALRWQLSRGTLANQRSQGRGRLISSWPVGSDTAAQISAYEEAGFVSPEPAATASFGDQSEVRETVERLIRTLGS